jgi:hypothetical protein
MSSSAHNLPSSGEIAVRLRGDRYGDRVRCPGPGHSCIDRSLEVWLRPDAPDGFILHSFAGDDPLLCRDHVRDAIGLPPWRPGRPSGSQHIVQPRARGEAADPRTEERRRIARLLWARSLPGKGSLAEKYLRSRGIVLERWPATLRFLSANPPDHPWPAMIGAFGLASEPEPGILAIAAHDVVGVQLTHLRPDGDGKAPIEPEKRTIGRGHRMPIQLAPMSDSLGLVVAEGIEDALSVHVETGLGAWAAGGAGRLAALADVVPSHVDTVTVIADDDDAGRKGAGTLAAALRARCIDAATLHFKS